MLLIEKNPVFPPRKGHFCLFLSVSLCVCLAFFLASPFFNFYFSVSLFLFFFLFLLVSFFAFFCFLVFVSFFPVLSSLLLFHEKNNIKILNYEVFLHQYFLFFWFPVLFFFEIPFSYLCFLLIISYVFVQHQCILFQKNTSSKTPIFGQEGVGTIFFS